jgi:outer membrane protein TolC
VLLVAWVLTPCMAQSSSPAPVLTLNDALQTAIGNNRELKIANLEVEKSKWQVAAAKTRRLPGFKTFIFGSGDLSNPSFLFKKGSFGTFQGQPNTSKETPNKN